MSLIRVENLVKEYRRRGRTEQPGNKINIFKRGVFSGKRSILKAVDNMSFHIDEGEMVGYIGPNGAGKSTTIKMLTGILVPTSGVIEVNGIVPHKNRKKNARNIGVVFGQRTQLWWDLPVMDSFKLIKYIYDIPHQTFLKNMEEFIHILGMEDILYVPVRQLSLGQRMKADIAAALLHNPTIVFLDEPTIGLDALAKEKMREFIKRINHERKVTVILTTHDMSDVEELCDRMIIIDKGQSVYDGSLEGIRLKYGKQRTLVVEFHHEDVSLPPHLQLLRSEGRKKWLAFQRDEISATEAITLLAEKNEIVDLEIKETAIEEIIKNIYRDNSEASVE